MFFNKKDGVKNAKDSQHKQFEKFLFEGETILDSFGILDLICLTNHRLIFMQSDFPSFFKTSKEKITEIVFIDYNKIDGISWNEYSGGLGRNRSIEIKTRGFSHSIFFFSTQEDEVLKFLKVLNDKIKSFS